MSWGVGGKGEKGDSGYINNSRHVAVKRKERVEQ